MRSHLHFLFIAQEIPRIALAIWHNFHIDKTRIDK